MPKQLKAFKSPPKKYQPKGIDIVYEDHDILVIEKKSGLLTIATDKEKEKTAYYMLTNYIRRGNAKATQRLFIVHRLDRETSGLLIFAKNPAAKTHLQSQWQNFEKKYFAAVHGILEKKEDTITSYLMEQEEGSYKVRSVKNPKEGKLAKTEYRVLKTAKKCSLLDITLHTGRKHQIRVHFSEMGHPVLGDRTYGNRPKGNKKMALHSASIRFTHPVTKEQMSFTSKCPEEMSCHFTPTPPKQSKAPSK